MAYIFTIRKLEKNLKNRIFSENSYLLFYLTQHPEKSQKSNHFQIKIFHCNRAQDGKKKGGKKDCEYIFIVHSACFVSSPRRNPIFQIYANMNICSTSPIAI